MSDSPSDGIRSAWSIVLVVLVAALFFLCFAAASLWMYAYDAKRDSTFPSEYLGPIGTVMMLLVIGVVLATAAAFSVAFVVSKD